jgi:hypothetical protein
MYEAPGAQLAPFAWVSAEGRRVEDIAAYLTGFDGIYPKTLDDIRRVIATARSSAQMIEALSQGKSGTPDKRIIADQICPDLKPSVTIEITWRGGKPPDLVKQTVQHHVQIRA